MLLGWKQKEKQEISQLTGHMESTKKKNQKTLLDKQCVPKA